MDLKDFLPAMMKSEGQLCRSDFSFITDSLVSEVKNELTDGECDCCLSRTSCESVRSSVCYSTNTITYAELLKECLGLALAGDDQLICSECIGRLSSAHKFRNQVLEAQQTLAERRLYKQEENEEIDFWDDEDNEPLNTIPPSRSKKAKRRMKKKKYEQTIKYEEQTINCDFCNKMFTTEIRKKKHMLKNHLKCATCNTTFETNEQAKEHMREHPTEYKCNYCSEKFDSIYQRRKHVYAIHGIRCRICGEMVTKNMYQHKIEKHGASKLQCGACDVTFYVKSKLLLHQRQVHMQERTMPCPECDYVAFGNRQLKRHMLRHGSEKVHACKYCNKKFVRKGTLQFHERIHTGDKRSVCKLCGEAFVQRASLKYHLEKYHPGLSGLLKVYNSN